MSSPYSLEKCRELVKAIEKGDLPWVRTLSSDPEIDLNWANQNEMGQTPFYLACLNGRTEIVEFFLESRGRGDREVDLNLADEHKRTPFLSACFHGYEGVVTLLLADQRVDVNQGQKYDQIPVSMAAERGKLAVVKLILASGRQIDLERRELNKGKNAHEIAMEMADRVWRAEGETIGEFLEKKARFREIAEIIREFQGDPGAVRARLRKELGFDGIFIQLIYFIQFHSMIQSLIHSISILSIHFSLSFDPQWFGWNLSLGFPCPSPPRLCQRDANKSRRSPTCHSKTTAWPNFRLSWVFIFPSFVHFHSFTHSVLLSTSGVHQPPGIGPLRESPDRFQCRCDLHLDEKQGSNQHQVSNLVLLHLIHRSRNNPFFLLQ